MLNRGVGEGMSYSIPAAEIAGFEPVLNRFKYYAIDQSVYLSPSKNFGENLHDKWGVDNDAFAPGRFLRPCQGAM